jgi:heme A synthase
MNRIDALHLLAAILAFAAVAVIGLWSWNTLAELFGAPQAQFRHAVAALALITTLRLASLRRHPAFRRRP